MEEAPSPKLQLQEATEPSGSELASVNATWSSAALNVKSAVGGKGWGTVPVCGELGEPSQPAIKAIEKTAPTRRPTREARPPRRFDNDILVPWGGE